MERRQGRHNYVTPRHYLDFIKHFVEMINEKRQQLEEEQLHLNIGLKKLRDIFWDCNTWNQWSYLCGDPYIDTEQQVKDLQISLAQKNRELEEKNEQANLKLKQMVNDQQVAEEKKKEALELQKKLDIQNKEIEVQKAKAYADLDKAEPAILEAQAAVQGTTFIPTLISLTHFIRYQESTLGRAQESSQTP